MGGVTMAAVGVMGGVTMVAVVAVVAARRNRH